MQTYKELLTEKTRIRLTDPDRFEVLTMILDGASKIAKREQREVEEKDLISAVKSEISSTEKAIDLIKSKAGDTSKQEKELQLYKTYLPTMKSEDETRSMLQKYFILEEAERKPQNMGKVISYIKAGLGDEINQYDMKVVSKYVKEYLTN